MALGAFLVATAVIIVPGANALGVSKPFLSDKYAPTTTVDVTFDDPDLVSLAGIVLHFECTESGAFSEAIGLTVGDESPHARLVDLAENALTEGYGYNQAGQTGYGIGSGEHGGYSGNTDPVSLGGYGYSSGTGYGVEYQDGNGYGYSYGYDSGYGYGYDSGTLSFTFAWIQAAFVADEECTLVVEVVPKGRTTGDFESPRSLPFVPRASPIADAGVDLVAVLGSTVTLDGSLSIDPNDGPAPLTYTWVQEAGPVVSGLTGIDTDAPEFVVPDIADAVLTFNLTVFDGLDSDWDTVDVTIRLVAAPSAQSVLEGTQVTLDAQAASLTGLTFQWSLVSGPPVVFADAASLDTSFIAPEVDVDTPVIVRITAIQGDLVRFAEATITVRDNEAPVADAGIEVAIVSGLGATLAGASASDPEGDALTYQWTQLSGPGIVIQDAATLTPTVVASPVLTPTSASLVLTVRDGSNAIGKDVRHLIIQPDVVFANAGPDQGVLEGTTVILDGTGSRGATSYLWSVPNGITPVGTLDQAQLTFVAPAVTGTAVPYTFSLQINGPNGPAADSVVVTVQDLPAGGPQAWYLHTDGCLIADVAGLPTGSADTATKTAPTEDGACLRPAIPLLTPTVDFAATTAQALPAGQVTGTIYLSVLLPDTQAGLVPLGPPLDGVKVDISLVQNGVVLATQSQRVSVDTLLFDIDPLALPATLPGLAIGYDDFPVSFTTNAPVAAGQFQIRVRVAPTVPGLVYAIGAEQGAASVFQFPGGGNGQAPIAPTADATGPASANEGQNVQLSAAASIGTGLSHTWIQTAGPLVQLSSATAAQPSFTAPPVLAGTPMSFRLTVRASNGLTDSDDVVVTIADVPFVNVAPTANAGADRTAAPGATVDLTGTKSDQAGDYVFGRWTQSGTPLAGGLARTSEDDTESRHVRTFTIPANAADGTIYTFVWTVHDNHGAMDDDDVKVTVRAGATPPTTTPPPPAPEPTPEPAPTTQPPTQTPGPVAPPADPNLDSDGDGIPDRIERLLGSDPFNAKSSPSFDISGQLQIKRINGVNFLSWRGLNIALGYQLWSSNSPYVLLSTMDGAGNNTFQDDSGTGKETTKYKLTFFVEKTKAGGFLADASGLSLLPGWDESNAPTSLSSAETQKVDGLGWGVYVFLAAAAVLVAATVVVVVRFARHKL